MARSPDEMTESVVERRPIRGRERKNAAANPLDGPGLGRSAFDATS